MAKGARYFCLAQHLVLTSSCCTLPFLQPDRPAGPTLGTRCNAAPILYFFTGLLSAATVTRRTTRSGSGGESGTEERKRRGSAGESGTEGRERIGAATGSAAASGRRRGGIGRRKVTRGTGRKSEAAAAGWTKTRTGRGTGTGMVVVAASRTGSASGRTGATAPAPAQGRQEVNGRWSGC